MLMQAVQSSNLEAVGYDPATRTLRVKFKTGTYEYTGVPANVYNALVNASSVGTYLSANIKGKYPYAKV